MRDGAGYRRQRERANRATTAAPVEQPGNLTAATLAALRSAGSSDTALARMALDLAKCIDETTATALSGAPDTGEPIGVERRGRAGWRAPRRLGPL